MPVYTTTVRFSV